MRILLAIRCFFAILFHGALSDALLSALGIARRPDAAPVSAPAAPAPAARPTSDGALQVLAILQRDSRLIDFIMEDISGYADDQIGAAVRSLHDQAKESLTRYIKLQPVIDSVEGTFTRSGPIDPAAVKFIGNVPANTPTGGVLRHKGWKAAKVDLPALSARQDVTVLAPAEIEIE
ncbi:MAG TPA: DUF2760 domain-containing protein [Bryobacteraceae bacterium]|nr:DUF2760 domain-containing protein [Bryobacteraceae bacterium]